MATNLQITHINFTKDVTKMFTLPTAQIQSINYAHQQSTAPWDILSLNDFGSLDHDGCHLMVRSWGGSVTDDGDIHHLSIKAGLELFCVLFKQMK